MTSLQDQIGEDWKSAMKARDPKKDVLSLIKTELKNKAISERTGEGGTSVDDMTAYDVLNKMAKQRREAIDSFKAGGREDLAQKEATELEVIQAYLPKQMEQDEVEALVKTVIAEVGATSMKDMGKVMNATIAKAQGRAHGSKVQVAVKKLLGS
jgi:uncharacterized protein YqeY